MNQLIIYSKFLFFPLFLCLISVGAFTQTRQNLEAQRKEALQEIAETTRFLQEMQQNKEESVVKLNLITAQVVQFRRLIASINAEIAFFDRQINESSKNVKKMNEEIEKMKSEYAELVVQMYKNKGQYNMLLYILSAKDLNEAYRRMKYFQDYSEQRKNQVAEIISKQNEMRSIIEKLTEQKEEKDRLLAEQRQENKKMEAVLAEQDKEVNKLKLQENKIKEKLIAAQQREKKLHDEINKVIEVETKKITSVSSPTTTNRYDRLTPEALLISNTFKANKGKLPWPVENGTITGYFGVSRHPVFKDVRVENSGIDITTMREADVRAVYEGEVSRVVAIPGENMTVFIRHGNYLTVYQNLVDVNVKKGDKVKNKQIIGKVYTDRGDQTAVLHFEIREILSEKGNNKQNPEHWITKN